MLVYLHGLNSSSSSYKAGLFRERLAPAPVVAPAYPAHRPDRGRSAALGLLSRSGRRAPPLVVGSSMGGFYGQYLARRFPFSHLFMINPALTPWDLLRRYVGQTQTTAIGETYSIDRS